MWPNQQLWPSSGQNDRKLELRWIQVGTKLELKSTKKPSKFIQNLLLGRSWGSLGPILAPRADKTSKILDFGCYFGTKLDPSWNQAEAKLGQVGPKLGQLGTKMQI